MARQKKIESDAAATEIAAKKTTVRTVDALHTIKYTEPVTVPVPDPEPEEAEEIIDAEEFEEDDTEPKAQAKSLRTRLREKLAKLGIADQTLKLRIDRLPHYDVNGQSGINAEKEYIRTTTCTEAFFDNDEYLEHVRSVGGPGTYWLTVRGGKSVMQQWQVRIGGAPQSPATENPIETYQPSAAPVDPMGSLLKQAKQFGELRKLLFPEVENQPARNPNDGQQATEQALFTLMNADNSLVETVASKLRGFLRGNGASSETERSWVDVLYAAIQNDTLPKLISQLTGQIRPGVSAVAGGDSAQSVAPADAQQSPDMIAYQRLISVLINCARTNGDVIPALQAIDGFVALFPEHAGAVDGFLSADVEIALPALGQSSPMAAEVVQLPHAADWFGKLKAAYFDSPEIEVTENAKG